MVSDSLYCCEGRYGRWVGVSVRVTPGIISMSLWFMLGHYYTATAARTGLEPNGFSMDVGTGALKWNITNVSILRDWIKSPFWPLLGRYSGVQCIFLHGKPLKNDVWQFRIHLSLSKWTWSSLDLASYIWSQTPNPARFTYAKSTTWSAASAC